MSGDGVHNAGGVQGAVSGNAMTISKNLFAGRAFLEFYAWAEADGALPGWSFEGGGPHGESSAPTPAQDYFVEYHLEFFRQQGFNRYPSRLHSHLLFATRADAEAFAEKHPERTYGRRLIKLRASGPCSCSFHDGAWLDYLRQPHTFDLEALSKVAKDYWSGRTVEEAGLPFLGQPWREVPVIEALVLGEVAPVPVSLPRSLDLPGFA